VLALGRDLHEHAEMRSRAGWAAAATAAVVGAGLMVAAPAAAVDTDIAISTTAIDFGQVNVGSTAQVSVTLTNTGGDPFGPINMFGGAPPTNEFNASQNCQAKTLPAGGSCMVNYSFSPGAIGNFTDMSSFTVSETMSQSDGEDFTVTLAGAGVDPTATTTTSTTTATTTTTTVAGTPPPANPGNPGNPTPGNPNPAGNTPTSAAAELGELKATVRLLKVALGQEQNATVRGFQAGEAVTAVMTPGERELGSETADDDGVVEFEWTIPETEQLGSHEFVARGASSGTVSARFTVVATEAEAEEADDDSDDGVSALLVALLVLLVLAAIGGAAYYAYRRGRAAQPSDSGPPETDPDATTEHRLEP
jgi:hypothetical protein